MSEKKLTSPKLQKWREWMEAIEPEIRLLLRDARVFWELRIIIYEHQRTRDFHYGYLERSYLAHVLMGLRRQLKPDKGHISLVRLLNDVAKNLKSCPAVTLRLCVQIRMRRQTLHHTRMLMGHIFVHK